MIFKLKLSRKEKSLVRKALNCQAIALESNSENFAPSYTARMAALEMRNIAKRISY